jgi:hypothetical protein
VGAEHVAVDRRKGGMPRGRMFLDFAVTLRRGPARHKGSFASDRVRGNPGIGVGHVSHEQHPLEVEERGS